MRVVEVLPVADRTGKRRAEALNCTDDLYSSLVKQKSLVIISCAIEGHGHVSPRTFYSFTKLQTEM